MALGMEQRCLEFYRDAARRNQDAGGKEVFEKMAEQEEIHISSLNAKLEEIVRLVGIESLLPKEQLVLDTAKSLREDFLHQNAFDDVDTYTSPNKMYLLLKLILNFHNLGIEALDNSKNLKDIIALPVKDKIAKAKMTEESKLNQLDDLFSEIKEALINL